MKVLVIPDKFKGTLTSRQAADAIAEGWHQARPKDELQSLPMTDGGDGFGEVMGALLGAKRRTILTKDAAHRPCETSYWWDEGTETAIIETARIIGLAMLPHGQYHPFELDTFGLARVFEEAYELGAKTCLVGIGGSATNDGGFGMACGLGWQFLDAHGSKILRWTSLPELKSMAPPPNSLRFQKAIVAVDVQNLLLGPVGATRVYGPQKGLKPQDFPVAEASLLQLATVAKSFFQADYPAEPGTGAAGGLGFGLRAFLGAHFEGGFELFARYAGLQERLKAVDLVITGEGCLDRSSLMGKGVGALARVCKEKTIPVIALAGSVIQDGLPPELMHSLETANHRERPLFTLMKGIVPDLTTLDKAKSHPQALLTRLAAQAASEWKN